ncbi:hypothetical protein VTK56DRAFT_548 [Thermocarpiscus australiensis]
MSFRLSDAYARRPSDDDRRAPDSRDRRRESYARGGFDPYKDDRHRRDTDTYLKGRRNSSFSPRETPSAEPPKLDTAALPLPTSRPPATSPDGNKSNVCDKLVKLPRKHAEAIIEVARLRAERDPLDKVLRQRKAEYEKSMIKHAEFPSVPELQNMHRTKYAERVRLLDDQIQKAQAEVQKTAEAIASTISSLPWNQSKENDNKVATSAGGLQQQATANKRQQAEIDDLKAQIRQMQAERSQEREDLKAEFARMKGEAEEMRKVMKEMKGMKGMKEEVKEEVKEQLRLVRGDFERRQTEQVTDLRSRLSKHEKQLKGALEQRLTLVEQSSSSDKASSTEISTLIQQENSLLRSAVDGVLRRVEEFTRQLAQLSEEVMRLKGDTATDHRQLWAEMRRVEGRVEEHETKLSNIDFDALEGVAETMSFAFPNLQRKVEGIQSNVDNVPQETESRHKALLGQVQEFLSKMGTTVGLMVDGLQNTVQDHQTRIKALESASTGGGRPNGTEVLGTRLDLDLISSNGASESIKAEVDSIKAVVGGVSGELARLLDQFNQLSLNVATLTKDINDQMDLLRHLVTDLDTRFTNLSTKSMAEQIIQQLEQVYPNAREIAADIHSLKTLVDNLSAKLGSLEARVQDYKGKVADFENTFENSFSGIKEQLFEAADAYLSNGVAHKRRKLNPNVNGDEHAISNGIN